MDKNAPFAMKNAMLVPLTFTWGHFVDILIQERGGMTELARYLQDIAPTSAKLSDDTTTVERGLRRLRQRGNAEGNKYGRLLLRCFGIPIPIVEWARELGMYHRRSSDLSVQLRRDQLRLWDCPPINETPSAAWIHIGLASVAHREKDRAQLQRRMELAQLFFSEQEPGSQLEYRLLEARIQTDQGRFPESLETLELASSLLKTAELPSHDAACFRARILDQKAYTLSRGWKSVPDKLDAALALYQSIDLEEGAPFVAFRRFHGIAWCLWRQGKESEALLAAQKACSYAGDGGFIRLRIMSLGQQANILGSDSQEGRELLERARGMAKQLQDRQLFEKLDV